MKTVFKFPLQIATRQTIEMPAGALVLSVQVQNNLAQLWALVDTDSPPRHRTVFLLGTGHDAQALPAAATYFGTIQMEYGFVYHVFVEA